MLRAGLAGAVICVSDDDREEFLSRGEVASMSGYNRKADNFEEEQYDHYKRMNSVRTEDLTGETYGW